jgi:uncharacterized protein YacL
MLKKNLRLVLTIAGILGGLSLMFFQIGTIQAIPFIPHHPAVTILILVSGSLVGGLVGFFLFPLATWIEGRLAKTALIDIVFGAIGLIVGLLISVLLGFILEGFPILGPLFSVLAALVFGYLGISVGTRKRDEATTMFSHFGRRERREHSSDQFDRPLTRSDQDGIPKVLDTSVIIDGRIADIVKTGFLEGPLVIPGFVLEELRHIADSSDVLKRNRGRRGLDILNRIQKELSAQVVINEDDIGEGLEVDSKLLKLSKALNGKVVTNDFNLNKVAELQGVAVLNINELANAVKPAVLPGEEMIITVIKDGKEVGQGVAYLDDGTMIVVDGGKRHIGDTIGVTVTSVLQTAAGRMIFAKPKLQVERVAP